MARPRLGAGACRREGAGADGDLAAAAPRRRCPAGPSPALRDTVGSGQNPDPPPFCLSGSTSLLPWDANLRPSFPLSSAPGTLRPGRRPRRRCGRGMVWCSLSASPCPLASGSAVLLLLRELPGGCGSGVAAPERGGRGEALGCLLSLPAALVTAPETSTAVVGHHHPPPEPRAALRMAPRTPNFAAGSALRPQDQSGGGGPSPISALPGCTSSSPGRSPLLGGVSVVPLPRWVSSRDRGSAAGVFSIPRAVSFPRWG